MRFYVCKWNTNFLISINFYVIFVNVHYNVASSTPMHYQALDWIDTFLSTWLYRQVKPHGLTGQPNKCSSLIWVIPFQFFVTSRSSDILIKSYFWVEMYVPYIFLENFSSDWTNNFSVIILIFQKRYFQKCKKIQNNFKRMLIKSMNSFNKKKKKESCLFFGIFFLPIYW